ncbi:MAG: class IV adenylate cyclase [Candidatus Liptonbacteria bacterium]|nr:class IV adenylate cyclase [Candidatus Liptonbacteria bacterium]
MREIEVKLKVKDLEALEQVLKTRGCVLSAPVRQHDTIYSKAGDTSIWERMEEGDIVLRIRRDDKGAMFTIKQQLTHELDNTEYETRIENPETFHKALLLLGFAPEVEVKKTRREGKLGSDEICLDEVEELGNFVELERLTDDDVDPEKVAEELYGKLESLGLSRNDAEKRGYDTQIYQLSIIKKSKL